MRWKIDEQGRLTIRDPDGLSTAVYDTPAGLPPALFSTASGEPTFNAAEQRTVTIAVDPHLLQRAATAIGSPDAVLLEIPVDEHGTCSKGMRLGIPLGRSGSARGEDADTRRTGLIMPLDIRPRA